MDNTFKVNLMTDRQTAQSGLLVYAPFLSRVSYLILGAVVVLGVVAGGTFIYLENALKSQQEKQARLLSQLKNLNLVEAKYNFVKNRINIISPIRKNFWDWRETLLLIGQIVSPPILRSITVSEQNKITLSLEFPNFASARDVNKNLLTLDLQKRIRQLTLELLNITSSGALVVNYSFFAAGGK